MNDTIDIGNQDKERLRLRPILIYLLISLVIVVGIVLVLFLWKTTTQHSATLEIRNGEVQTQSVDTGVWQLATDMMEVNAGDWIWVADDAIATIHYFEGSRTLITGPTQLQLKDSYEVTRIIGGGRTNIELKITSGKVLSEVVELPSASSVFRVITPSGAIQGQDTVFESDVDKGKYTNWLDSEPKTMVETLVVNTEGKVVVALVPLEGGSYVFTPQLPDDVNQGDAAAVYEELRTTAFRLLQTASEAGRADIEYSGTSLISSNPDTGSAVYSLLAASDMPVVTPPEYTLPSITATSTIVQDQILEDVGITLVRSPVLAIPSIPELALAEIDAEPTPPPTSPRYLFSIWGIEQAEDMNSEPEVIFLKPRGVAIDPYGRFVYITEIGGLRRTYVFDGEGTRLGVLAPTDSAISDVASRSPIYVDVKRTTATIYVSDRSRHCIDMYDYTGSYIGKFTPEDFDGTSWAPVALTFDRRTDQWDDLYITEFTSDKHRVMVFDYNGNLKLEFGKKGEGVGELSFPNGVAVDSLGKVFVADSNNFRLRLFSPEGEELGALDAGLPRGLAINEEDLLHVVDTFGHHVIVFQVGEQFTRLFSFGGSGIGAGEANYPNGIAVDDNGRIYITDRENDRVQVWTY